MIQKKNYRKVQVQLQAFLAERLDQVSVRIGDSIHYPGTNVVVTSQAFRGLLPEQRFHHLVRAVPPDFYEQYLRGGIVWFELAPGETAHDLMRMPRSEDAADDQAAILEQLKGIGFFKEFQEALDTAPQEASIDDFTVSRRILISAGLIEPHVTRACLWFILQGAFCDAQLLADVVPKLAADHAA